MSLLLNANGEHLKRTTGLPSTSAFTIMAWCYFLSLPGLFEYHPLFIRWDANDVGFQPNDSKFALGDNGQTVHGSTISVNTWYHCAWVRVSTTSDILYVNAVSDLTADLENGTTDSIKINDWSYNTATANTRVAALKIFDTNLTKAQIDSEMRQYLPVNWSSLNAFYPMLGGGSISSTVRDYSGFARDWTITGSPTIDACPPIPWSVRRKGYYIPVVSAASTGSGISCRGLQNPFIRRRTGLIF